eukprot:CAMPEP_0172480100 /NCGR_PEP_ID=MMETSP1066-20121228/5035_1 /TAXON_ID=671091 /ORGANISM="Coscinodiscus wailesii, Strain CCMP2513" /LENGTH=62 /DNA_ID=CAMNT_0013241121 /DNA_START=370 /DNA_END=558 /DNA_ORIENTATION=+
MMMTIRGGRLRELREFLGGAFALANVPQDKYQVVMHMEASIPSGYAYGGTDTGELRPERFQE